MWDSHPTMALIDSIGTINIDDIGDAEYVRPSRNENNHLILTWKQHWMFQNMILGLDELCNSEINFTGLLSSNEGAKSSNMNTCYLRFKSMQD